MVTLGWIIVPPKSAKLPNLQSVSSSEVTRKAASPADKSSALSLTVLAAVAAVPVAAPATGGEDKPAEKAEKKEEKSKEDEKKAEESAAAGLGALFG